MEEPTALACVIGMLPLIQCHEYSFISSVELGVSLHTWTVVVLSNDRHSELCSSHVRYGYCAAKH
jgi:hypothetical protein